MFPVLNTILIIFNVYLIKYMRNNTWIQVYVYIKAYLNSPMKTSSKSTTNQVIKPLKFLLFLYIYTSLVYVVMSWRKSLSWLGCTYTMCMYNELADIEANKIKTSSRSTTNQVHIYAYRFTVIKYLYISLY
jgi:hypothetical protein